MDPTDEIYLASFPGGHAGTARHFLKKIIPAALQGEYRMADILNSPCSGISSTSRASRCGCDCPPPWLPSSTKAHRVGQGRHRHLREGRQVIPGARQGRRSFADSSTRIGTSAAISLPEYREAMNHFHHAPMLTVNVAVRNWKFLEKLGIASARWFEGFGWWVSLRRNLEIPGQVTQPLDPSKPTVLTMYNPFPLPGVPFPQQCTHARMQLFNMSYAQIEAAVREPVYEDVRGLRIRREPRHRRHHHQSLGPCLHCRSAGILLRQGRPDRRRKTFCASASPASASVIRN